MSGYVRTKLKVAEALVEDNPDYKKNVDALKKVIPKDIPGLQERLPRGMAHDFGLLQIIHAGAAKLLVAE